MIGFVPRSKTRSVCVIAYCCVGKLSQIFFCGKIHAEHMYTMCGQTAETCFGNFRAGGYLKAITGRRWFNEHTR